MKHIILIFVLIVSINAKETPKQSIKERVDLAFILATDKDTLDDFLDLTNSLELELGRDKLTAVEVKMIFQVVALKQGLHDAYVTQTYPEISKEDLDKHYNSVTSLFLKQGKSLNEIIDIAIMESRYGITPTQILLFQYLNFGQLSTMLGIDEPTMNKIISYATECAQSGNKRCSYELGTAYYYGRNLPQDKDKGLDLILRGVNHFPEAAEEVARHYHKKGDEKMTIKYLKIASKLGSARSSYNLGTFGMKLNLPYNQVIDYFNLALKQDPTYTVVHYGFAQIYYDGYGVKTNYDKVIEHLNKINKEDLDDSFEGNVNYMLSIAYAIKGNYARGERDYEKAVEFYHKSESYGHGEPAYIIGQMYLNGEYFEKDIEKTIEYYKRASDLGNARGHFWYGHRLFQGRGIKQDIQKGISMMKEAESVGYAVASLILSDLYYLGALGIEKDLELSKLYLSNALQSNEHGEEAMKRWKERFGNND